ncbi:hypothetical protein SLS60_003214 [Paraconiothyrium brasiliense]|uniref:Uncharacterized protein n=1 Tax=Paraconiothyrium brasiliense TaxID=300254 RepID=A0ABR3RV27_9PLEO
MTHNEDLWTFWGRYTNEAAIKAASNFDEIVLNFSGRTMFAVHPVPDRYLNCLNPEERRMLRQHLDYILREGVHDDFDRAAGETLTNLNTLANVGRQRNVHFNNEVKCDDGTRYRSPFPGEGPREGLFNHFDTPMPAKERRPRQHAQFRSQQHASNVDVDSHGHMPPHDYRDTSPRYESSPPTPADYSVGTGPAADYHDDAMLSSESGCFGEENFDHSPPQGLRSIMRSASHRFRPQQPKNPEEFSVRVDALQHSHQQDAQGRITLPARESTSHSARSLQEHTNEPYESDDHPSSFNILNPDLYPLRPDQGYVDDIYDSVSEHRSQDRAAEHGETPAPSQRRVKSPAQQSAAQAIEVNEKFARTMQQEYDHEDMARELQFKLHVGGRQDGLGIEYRGRTKQQPASRYDYDQRSYEGRIVELDNERLPRTPGVVGPALYSEGDGTLRGVGLEHRRFEDRRPSQDRDLLEGRHYESGRHRGQMYRAEDEHRLHGHHRSARTHRPTFGPFPSSLIRTIIRNGTRSEFFEALYTLHPNQAPSVYRIHRYRNAERTSRHKPAIEALMRLGRVKDVERVFEKANADVLFEELGGDVKDRKAFW